MPTVTLAELRDAILARLTPRLDLPLGVSVGLRFRGSETYCVSSELVAYLSSEAGESSCLIAEEVSDERGTRVECNATLVTSENLEKFSIDSSDWILDALELAEYVIPTLNRYQRVIRACGGLP